MAITERDVEQALEQASAALPFGITLDKCAAAQFVYGFLMQIKENNSGNWPLVIAIRALHGAISKARKGWGC